MLKPAGELTGAQLYYADFMMDVLIYTVVLNLFVEYVDGVVIASFTVSLLTAIVLKLLVDLLQYLVDPPARHHIAAEKKGDAGRTHLNPDSWDHRNPTLKGPSPEWTGIANRSWQAWLPPPFSSAPAIPSTAGCPSAASPTACAPLLNSHIQEGVRSGYPTRNTAQVDVGRKQPAAVGDLDAPGHRDAQVVFACH